MLAAPAIESPSGAILPPSFDPDQLCLALEGALYRAALKRRQAQGWPQASLRAQAAVADVAAPWSAQVALRADVSALEFLGFEKGGAEALLGSLLQRVATGTEGAWSWQGPARQALWPPGPATAAQRVLHLGSARLVIKAWPALGSAG